MKRRNKLLLMVALINSIVGYAIVSWMTQQIDLMISPLIYKYAMNWEWWLPGKGWFGTMWYFQDAYVRFLYLIHLGYWITFFGWLFAFYLWEEER